MDIRQATKEDATIIAPLLLEAMEEIVYVFINENNKAKALEFLTHFIQRENNQYSFENIFVAEIENQIVGAINIYDGENLHELRNSIVKYIAENYDLQLILEDETEAGEWYLDTLGVDKNYRGHGIGTALIKHSIDYYKNSSIKKLGLLVDLDNPKAKRLYLSLGFTKVGEKTLVGKNLEHLQFDL